MTAPVTYHSLSNRIIYSPLTHIAIETIQRNKEVISELNREKMSIEDSRYQSEKKHEKAVKIRHQIQDLLDINISLNYYINYRLTK